MARSRHGSLAEQLAAIQAYINRPAGVDDGINAATHEPGIGTNWRAVPTGETAPSEVSELAFERSWRMSPGVGRIMAEVAKDDVERDDAGRIIRIGRLRFSDGTQTEPVYRYAIDGKLERYAARMPVGAMLGCRDKPEAQLGGDDDTGEVSASNRYFEEVFGVEPRTRKVGAKRRTGKHYSRREAVAMLAEATANTDMSTVTVTHCPPGLPAAGARISDSFLGCKKETCGESGAIAWEDIYTSKAERDLWAAAVAALSENDRLTLRNVERAGTISSIAESGHVRTRERAGARALRAANDNLSRNLKKYAA